MPRPPILEKLNYEEIFASAKNYEQWLEADEEKENVEKIRNRQAELTLPELTKAFLRALDKPVHVLAIAECWCGDVVRHTPVLMKLAEQSDKIRVRFTAREENQEAFKRFLTNGGEAIPKFVFFNENFVECGNYGPMPLELKKIISRGKAAEDVKAARERVSKLYEADPNCELEQSELLDLLATAACTKP